MKRKSKETGAVLAIGGWDYIKSNTAASFNKLQDYSVYLHSQYDGTPDYEQALAAAMAEVEKALLLVHSLANEGRLHELKAVVVDEFHMVGKPQRRALERLLTLLVITSSDQ